MPPVPKPAEQRRRRNAAPAVQKLPAAGRRGGIPKPKTDVVLGAVALDYWRTIWMSPMALVFTKADVFPLSRLVVLVDQRERLGADAFDDDDDGNRRPRGSFDGDAEIRQLEDRFGLSPLARRRLEWEITKAEDAPAVRKSGEAPGDRMRARLHSVG